MQKEKFKTMKVNTQMSGGNPAKMIDFTNEKAVMWKIEKINGKLPTKK